MFCTGENCVKKEVNLEEFTAGMFKKESMSNNGYI